MTWAITDFAKIEKSYTGATNKRKWIIINKDILLKYFEECGFKPSDLKNKLNTTYSTVKRLLIAAALWDKAVLISTGSSGGRKRISEQDKFGYKYASKEHDIRNDRGDLIRRAEHHVIAEIKYGRKIGDREVVHHIDLDKSNNTPSNLFICEDNRHHRRLHGNLETVAGEAVRAGLIKFHPEHGYYLNNKEPILED